MAPKTTPQPATLSRTVLNILYDQHHYCAESTRKKKQRGCPNSLPTAALGITPVPRHLPSVKNVSEQVRILYQVEGYQVTSY